MDWILEKRILDILVRILDPRIPGIQKSTFDSENRLAREKRDKEKDNKGSPCLSDELALAPRVKIWLLSKIAVGHKEN